MRALILPWITGAMPVSGLAARQDVRRHLVENVLRGESGDATVDNRRHIPSGDVHRVKHFLRQTPRSGDLAGLFDTIERHVRLLTPGGPAPSAGTPPRSGGSADGRRR